MFQRWVEVPLESGGVLHEVGSPGAKRRPPTASYPYDGSRHLHTRGKQRAIVCSTEPDPETQAKVRELIG